MQQAAYSLIPQTQKQATHLKIGQRLLANTPTIELEEKIFDIVNHFNYAIELIWTLDKSPSSNLRNSFAN
ncbi:hypothetical protein [Merismopedia glauca]|uniref:hypothetical protein n=1 Tax=Merismopedia glauca TaxID=292586 RepID=UPI001FE58C9B|nr:hypothetical protein [Merismopedia glauca]